MSLSFSIVINTLNRADVLKTALSSLHHLRHPNFEVIVVNGPSTDTSEEVIAAFAGKVRHARCPEANLSMSRNIGIGMACGDIVCFMDDDAVPEPDWLDELASAYTNPDIGAVGGFTRDHTGVSFQTRALLCDRFGDGQNFESLEQAEAAIVASEAHLYFSQTGTNSSFRRDVLLHIGGFDEHFAYFLDETDVNWRVLQAGYQVAYAPNAEIHHKYAPSHLRTEARVPKSLYLPARSKAYFAMRNAWPDVPLSDVLAHLSAYEVDLHGHNRWYLENGVVDAATHTDLNDGISRGLKDGLRAALLTDTRVLLAGEKKGRAFKPYPIGLPADDRLRLCMLSQSYPPHGKGGIALWTYTVATELARIGHEVTVVSLAEEGNPHTVDYEDGVWVHRIAREVGMVREELPLDTLPVSRKEHAYAVLDEVRRIDQRRGLDVVSGPIWDVEGMACLEAGELPFVLSLHTPYKLSLPHKPDWSNDPTYMKNHVLPVIEAETAMLTRAPNILANSQAVLDDIEAAYSISLQGEHVTYVPHGLPDWASEHQGNTPTKPADRTRVLFVGRFEARKGISDLLTAIVRLAPCYRNVDFVLAGQNDIGTGKQRFWDAFSSEYSNTDWFGRIIVPGEVDQERLLREYAACDIFVGPSRYESFGLIFLEAMMFAKPCIGTSIGGIREVVSNKETGLLVPPSDPAALAGALEQLINDADLRKKLGDAGRARYEAKFTAAQMGRSVLEVYRKAAQAQSISNT